ncbi:MAG TPA: hypothetical protein VMI33_19460 [Streptosporangiaceae bacterium]|nr:hypothetical protein [Streptosporangiaceae bacterium]
MSSIVPLGGGSHHGGRHRWKTVRYALENEERTRRLCRIVLAMSIAPVVVSITALAIALMTGHVV